MDLTFLMALSTIASEQAKGTDNTILKTKQLIDYLATHSDATVQFYASDMVEHSLGCVILIVDQHTHQGVWPCLHGMEA